MLFPRPYGGATATPPYPSWSRTWAWSIVPPPHKLEILIRPSLKFSCQDQLNTEQDVLTMKESPLKNLILFFLRPHHHGGDCKMTNSFCCLYLLFSVSVPAPSSFIKMLDPCTHNVHVLHVCACLLIVTYM